MIDVNLAEKLIHLGFSLVPLNDKVPIFKNWQKDTITFENYKEQIKSSKCNNIGLVCGINGVEVVDVDLKVFASLKEQQDFWNEYLSFLKDNIDEFDKKFVIAKTKNAGYHIIYRWGNPAGNQKIATLENKKCVIESRGKGGQVVMYDNFVSDLKYNDIQYISTHDRAILWQCTSFYNYTPPVDDTIEEIKKSEPKQEIKHIENFISIADDFNNRNTVWDVVSSDFSIVRKIGNKTILKRNGSDHPYCGSILDNKILFQFSDQTKYLQEKGQSAYSCYAHKNHNGNYSEASKELYKQGYGTRYEKKPDELKIIPKIEKEVVFPIEIFPIEIQNYLLKCNDTLNSSIEYMGCSMLWAMSLCVGNSFKIKVKNGWIESGILWLVIVGNQGIGKTPSINNIISPLKRINSDEYKKYKHLEKKYDDYMLLDKEQKKNAIELQKPVKTQFIVNDITLEALIEMHETTKNSLGIYRDELAGWIKDMNKYRAGSDIEHWLSSWSNDSINLTRKTAKSSFVDKPFMPVLGGVQPSIFNQFYTDDNKENGFIDRLLISYPDLVVDAYNDEELDENIINWFSEYITNFFKGFLLAIKYYDDGEINSYCCYFSNEAKTEWKRIFNEISSYQNSDDENDYLKSMFPKQKSYIPRFALLIHCLDGFSSGGEISLQIEKESILKAEKLSKYFIYNAKKIKINNIEQIEAKTIIELNKTKNKKEVIDKILVDNPNISKTELAKIMNISRQQLYNYLKTKN